MASSEVMMNLKCSICNQRFHDPIILDCGHTFDRFCIEQMIDTNQSFRPVKSSECPACHWIFDVSKSLVSNVSLIQAIKCDATFEWFLIDIASSKQTNTALLFLKHVFSKREILHANHITLETNDAQMTIDSTTDFDKELRSKSLSNLGQTLHDIVDHLQNQDGKRKICILTDGSAKHSKLSKIDSNIIHQRVIIHIGDNNQARTRTIADQINFQFGYFTEKTVDYYVQQFLRIF